MQELFSQRYPVRPSRPDLIYDAIPKQATWELVNILADYRRRNYTLFSFPELYKKLFDIPEVKRKHRFDEGVYEGEDEDKNHLSRLLQDVDWFTFFDACEVIIRAVSGDAKTRDAREVTERFMKDVNDLFHSHGLGYEIRDKRVERIGATFVDRGVARARVLLADPRFAGPDEQFGRAVEAFSRRPEPDCANAVKDAVGALEGVARIVSGDVKATLAGLLKTNQRLKELISPPLVLLLEKVYAYRGDREGVAHGQTVPLQVGVEEAELMIGYCASSIIYLAKKAGAQTV